MTIKKIGVFIATTGLITALVIGCGSSSTNNNDSNSTGTENNSTEMGLEAGNFYGSAFSFILKGLANGMLSTIVSDAMGNFLPFLDGGDSGNTEEMNELKDIDSKLTQISNELVTIEGELKAILTDIKVSEDSIKNDVDWPRGAINNIDTATQALQELGVDVNGSKIKPGEGNHTKIANLASDILGAKYDIPLQVMSIYNSIEGNPTPLLSNYIDQVMLQLPNNDNENLQKAYQGFEYYTSQLLNNQIQGVNLVVEAHKAQDNNSSAQKYLNCYDSNMYNTSECNLLHKEIGDMDNKTSFIYNAVSLVLRDAPIYDPFLPTSAESILKQAEFYRLLMAGTDDKKFGLRLFHISTMDRPVAPDHLYASKDSSVFHNCDASRHVVEGHPYDQWNNDSVDSNTDYRIVEYACGSVPIGTYSIYPSESSGSKVLTTAEVANYDAGYAQKDDGNITYGMGLMHDYINNRFVESWGHWGLQKHADENVQIFGSANDWPVGIKIDFQNQYSDFYGSTELDGYFTYSGSTDKKITIDYHAKIYLKASAEKVYLGSKPWAEAGYKTGVWNSTNSDSECSFEHTLNAGSGHSYLEYDHPQHTCTFTAKPGHHYYVYFKMFNKGDETDDWDVSAESKLEEVYRVYVKFDE